MEPNKGGRVGRQEKIGRGPTRRSAWVLHRWNGQGVGKKLGAWRWWELARVCVRGLPLRKEKGTNEE